MHVKYPFIVMMIFCISLPGKASEVRKVNINQTELYYHYCKSPAPAHQLVIFLHGAVAAYQGQTESKPKELASLLEFNEDFIATLSDEGYDILIPVAFNQYNWLEPSGAMFIDTLMELYAGQYADIHLAGFSDGATGAYKYFYPHQDKVSALLLFNGYPQHNNSYKKVDHTLVAGHPILYVSQRDDKVVPYEFLLLEYRKQKLTNAQTYFLLLDGKHEFSTYSRSDFEYCLRLMEAPIAMEPLTMDSIWIYPAMDGLMIDHQVKEIFPFRQSIARKYGMDMAAYNAGQIQTHELNELMKNGELFIYPLKATRDDLSKDKFEFTFRQHGMDGTIVLRNDLNTQTW